MRNQDPHEETRRMLEESFTLTTFFQQWKTYHEHIKAAVAPLTAEQLTLRAAPGLRSIGENAAHIVGCRLGWFIYTLGEDASTDLKALGEKSESARTAAEL